MKKLLIFLFALNLLLGVEIDIKLLNQIVSQNPKDIQNRLLLSKYYLSQKEIEKAEKLAKEALQIDPKNKNAIKIYKKIKRIKTIKEILNDYGVKNIKDSKEIEKLFNSLYKRKLYEKFLTFYKLLSSQNINLSENVHKKAAFLYIKNKNFKKAKHIIQKKIKNDLSKEELKADLCFFKKEYRCAKKLYTSILKKGYSRHSLLYLLNSLFELKDYPKFEKLYKIVKKEYPQDFSITSLDEKLSVLKIEFLKSLKKSYEKNPSFETLKAYTTSLYSLKKEEEAIKTVKDFINKNPSNEKALLLLASMLIWKQEYKNSSKLLLPLANAKNQEAIKLLAKSLYYQGEYEKAIKYLKKAIEKEKDEKAKKELQKKLLFSLYWTQKNKEAEKLLEKIKNYYKEDEEIKGLELILKGDIFNQIKFYENKRKKEKNNKEIILKLAKLYEKASLKKKSIKYFEKYYNLTKDPTIMKYLAQTFYFEQKYQKALPYFKKYLKSNKNDYSAKYQYAISLQNTRKYKEAAKIYKELLNRKDKNYFDIKYRYGFCLLKTKNEKDWLKARETFKSLLNLLENELKKHPSSKELLTLLKFTKDSYEVSKREFLKPTSYKDIVLAEGLKKNLKEYPTLLTTLNALKAKPKKEYELKKLLPKNISEKEEKKKKEIEISAFYAKDSNDIKMNTISAHAKRVISIGKTEIGLYGEKFKIEDKKKYDGIKGALSFENKNFTLLLGGVFYDYFNEPYASIEYESKIYNHLINIFLEYQNGSLYENHPYFITDKISALQLRISDFIKLIEGKEFNMEISLTRFEDGNIRITPAFSYLFFNNRLGNVINNFYLTGWYQLYTKNNPIYVYAKKDDATRIELHSLVNLSKKLSLTPKLGIGYSFHAKSPLYTAGFIISYEINKFLYLIIDCVSNKIKGKENTSDYNYEECKSNIEYRW